MTKEARFDDGQAYLSQSDDAGSCVEDFDTGAAEVRTMELVTCPNCMGRDSSRWPFGPCTVCGGSGKTTPERRDEVLANAKAERAR